MKIENTKTKPTTTINPSGNKPSIFRFTRIIPIYENAVRAGDLERVESLKDMYSVSEEFYRDLRRRIENENIES